MTTKTKCLDFIYQRKNIDPHQHHHHRQLLQAHLKLKNKRKNQKVILKQSTFIFCLLNGLFIKNSFNNLSGDTIDHVEVVDEKADEVIEGLYCTIKPGEVPPIPENKFLARKVEELVKVEVKEKETRDVTESSKSHRDDRNRDKKDTHRYELFIFKVFFLLLKFF
jgi:hypothetical protein